MSLRLECRTLPPPSDPSGLQLPGGLLAVLSLLLGLPLHRKQHARRVKHCWTYINRDTRPSWTFNFSVLCTLPNHSCAQRVPTTMPKLQFVACVVNLTSMRSDFCHMRCAWLRFFVSGMTVRLYTCLGFSLLVASSAVDADANVRAQHAAALGALQMVRKACAQAPRKDAMAKHFCSCRSSTNLLYNTRRIKREGWRKALALMSQGTFSMHELPDFRSCGRRDSALASAGVGRPRPHALSLRRFLLQTKCQLHPRYVVCVYICAG